MSGKSGAVCRVLKSGESYVGKQGLTYQTGLTHETVGSKAICMTLVKLPPGARAKTHLHRGIETAVYVIEGEIEMYWGEGLREHLVGRAGEYMYVAADVPHLVLNRSSITCTAVVAHSAGDDQAGIEMRRELDGVR